MQIEHEGKTITVYTESEVEARIADEVKGLKTTNQNLKSEKEELQEKQREATEKARQAEEAQAKADGDVEKLTRLIDERAAEQTERYNKLMGQTKKEKINNALNSVVTNLGAGGEYNEDLRDLLKVRFEFDYDNESGKVKVTGDGVNSLDELEAKVKEGARYANYLAGSKASGGGAAGGKGSGDPSGKKFNEYSGAELKAIKEADASDYDRLRTQHYGT